MISPFVNIGMDEIKKKNVEKPVGSAEKKGKGKRDRMLKGLNKIGKAMNKQSELSSNNSNI